MEVKSLKSLYKVFLWRAKTKRYQEADRGQPLFCSIARNSVLAATEEFVVRDLEVQLRCIRDSTFELLWTH